MKQNRNTAEQAIRKLGPVLLATISLAGCGRSLPSESDARAVIEELANKSKSEYWQDNPFWGMRVVSVRKVDGQESTMLDVRYYQLVADIDVECVNTQPQSIWHPVPCTGKSRGQKLRLNSCSFLFSESEKGWNPDYTMAPGCKATEELSSVLPRRSESKV